VLVDQGQSFAVGVTVVIGLLLCHSIYRRRDAIREHIRYVLAVTGTVIITFWIALQYLPPVESVLIAGIVELLALQRLRPRRSRYISKRDRRKVIARFERSGERYDPKKHEIDHVVPHSRWGQNTADNLRVISRARNRSKSAKSPWWDVLGK
jgi:hypothetical protein